jgi:Tol biopolymer transport system component
MRASAVFVLLALVAGIAGVDASTPAPKIRSFPAHWSPDGTRLFFASTLRTPTSEALKPYVVSADGSGLAPVLPEPPDRPDGRYIRAADGRRIAFLREPGAILSLVDENGSETRELQRGAECISVSPDGGRIAYRGEQRFVADVKTGDVAQLGRTGCETSWSPDGSKIAASAGPWFFIVALFPKRLVFSSDGCCYNETLPVFSPDGATAAFTGARLERGDDSPVVHVVDLRSGALRELKAWGYDIDSWSPDSRRIAYVANVGIRILDVSTARYRLFLPGITFFRFSRDWSRYAFSAKAGRNGFDLYLGETGRGRARRVTPPQCTVLEDPCVALGSGDDRFDGGAEADAIFGGLGDDVISGGPGDDELEGELGNDRLLGESGSDKLLGGRGSDTLLGGSGSDQLEGEEGDDVLEGGAGADKLDGRWGNDRVSAGPGNDTVLTADQWQTLVDCGSGFDVVRADRGDRVASNCERISREG